MNFLELISRYDNCKHVYTNGSKMDDIVAASFTVPSLNIDRKFRLCDNSSVYAAELTAIMDAVLWILNVNIIISANLQFSLIH